MNRKLLTIPAVLGLLGLLDVSYADDTRVSVMSADEIVCALNPHDARCGRSIGVKPKPIELSIPFELNSAQLQPSAAGQLAELATALVSDGLSEDRIQIIGHTDDSGSADYNRRLSQLRAEAVRRFLVMNYNLPPARLEAVGRGEDEPLAGMDPSSPANRRVEIRIADRQVE